MHQRGQHARKEQPQQAADAGQEARIPIYRKDSEQQKGGDGGEQFELMKRYEAGNQDPRSNSSHGTDQWVLQVEARL